MIYLMTLTLVVHPLLEIVWKVLTLAAKFSRLYPPLNLTSLLDFFHWDLSKTLVIGSIALLKKAFKLTYSYHLLILCNKKCRILYLKKSEGLILLQNLTTICKCNLKLLNVFSDFNYSKYIFSENKTTILLLNSLNFWRKILKNTKLCSYTFYFLTYAFLTQIRFSNFNKQKKKA